MAVSKPKPLVSSRVLLPKDKIRELAEIEERKLYEERISDEWRDALAPLGTDASKPHLTDAPSLLSLSK